MNPVLLQVDDLKTYFFADRGVAKAVDGVSFTLSEGEVVALVGESGCGKSVTALSIMRLIPQPPGRIVGGQIMFKGQDLTTLSDDAMENLRGNDIAMVFQEPMTSLNPVFRVGDQIAEVLERHQRVSHGDALHRTVETLQRVGIPSPELRIRDYPHQMSGGMRQRVMIAMALACEPSLIIADEPTTAVDVTIQAQVLDLMRQLQKESGVSVLLITHDLGVVAEMAQHVLVMYAGRVVERATVLDLFDRPLHPYTQGLMHSIPALAWADGRKRLAAIPGMVPSLYDLPAGCKFSDRCSQVFGRCGSEPDLLEVDGHQVRCWLYQS
ncbi:MAG TPA: peptide ABC transporter ATP-binding protein [Syntrophobacteraceae bacterium]|nr:peptide ABC transporter ATP-binding protein [Syntrophobacteraceae bacterium]